MLEGLTPDLTSRLVLAVGGVGLALLVLIFVLLFLKRRNSPLFIKGGRAREPRLLVLDAAAVDPKRRLVLIRRDDVEHLIMIGGPTDIVIETGIGEQKVAPVRKPETTVEELVSVPREVAVAIPEAKPEPRVAAVVATPEKRPEPVVQPVVRQVERPVERPVAAQAEVRSEPRLVQPEHRPVQAEARPVQAEVKPVQTQAMPVQADVRAIEPEVRPVQAEIKSVIPELRPVQPEIKPAPAQPVVPVDTLPGRTMQGGDRNISSMGSMLYDEDREPMSGIRQDQPETVVQPAERPVLQQQAVETPVARPVQSIVTSEQREEPVVKPSPDAVEAALDLARSRVLSTGFQPANASMTPATSEEDEAKALAARLEAARADATRRVQSAMPASQFNTPPVAQPAVQPVVQPFTPLVASEPVDMAKASRDAVPSDFEKLLEAELDASGIFAASNAPHVKIEPRDPANPTAGFTAPAARTAPPITGASPDLSSEEEVARLLGEIAVNRKS